jgi:5-carboxyvanillate decarboxylase
MRLIATEEAYGDPVWLEALAKLPPNAGPEVAGLESMMKIPMVGSRMSDFEARVREMDSFGVSMHLLSLSTPGVQVFEPAQAVDLAIQLNDNLAALIKGSPDRFAGLGCVAPQDPAAAATEIKRATGELGLNGILINSHTQGEYLDLEKYDEILAALVEADAPLYLHPRIPPPNMVQPMLAYGLSGAVHGFAVEAALHAVRLIMSGAFDRYPTLTVVLGHMGEGLPYFLSRLDRVYERFFGTPVGTATGMVALKKRPSDYFKDNFYITTSGMFWEPTLKFGIEVLGEDRIMFAIDTPFEPSDAAVEFIRSVPLEESVREKIAHQNAERVFRIKPV